MSVLQYVEMDAFLHKLDPRSKFFFFLSMAIVTSFVRSGPALALLFLFFIFTWTMGHIGRYMVTLLGKMKILIIFIFILWTGLGLFTVDPGPTVWGTTFNIAATQVTMSFEWYDLYKGAVLALRIFLMISCFYTVIISTNFSDIILGLRKWHVPYAVAFGIGLVFQIIPIIIGEFSAIMEAQSSRGLEVEQCGPIQKMKNYVTASLPLLFRVLSKGHAISLAMYYYKLNFSVKRTSYKQIKATWYDALFVSLTVLSIGGAITLNILLPYAV